MKKYIQYALILILAGIFAVLFYYGITYEEKRAHAPVTAAVKKPPKIVENGPYGVNVDTTETMGEYMFRMKAARVYVKKTKSFGFDNALIKKVVARDVTVTVYKHRKIILKLHKDRFSTRRNLKKLKIEKPAVLFPDSLSRPDRVVIDKKRKRIVFEYGKDRDIWDLTQENYKEQPEMKDSHPSPKKRETPENKPHHT